MLLEELGKKLQDLRNEQNLSIEDVADKIKVSSRILKMIEEGNEKGLPHAVYARGFIISYGTILGLPPEELKKDLEGFFSKENIEESKVMHPIAVTNSSLNFLKQLSALILFVLILVGVGYGGWFVFHNYGENLIKMVKKPFFATKTPIITTAVREGSNSTSSFFLNSGVKASSSSIQKIYNKNAEQDILATKVLDESLTSIGIESSDGNKKSVQENNIVGNTTFSVNSTSETAEEKSQTITITGKDRCWIKITSDKNSGKSLYINAGESRDFTFTKTMSITFGNPGGVSLLVNGKLYEGNLKQNRPLTLNFP